MILAGDIGGTKTVLALYEKEQHIADGAVHEVRFENANFRSLEAILLEFLHQTKSRPEAAFLGVAGPIQKQQAQITNFPWVVSAADLRRFLGISRFRAALMRSFTTISSAVRAGENTFWLTPGGITVKRDSLAGSIAPR